MLISMLLTFFLYVEPPITNFFISHESDPEYNKYYNALCVGCHNDYIYYSVYGAQVFFAIIALVVVAWILWASFRKFAQDGATLAEEEDGSN